MWAIIGGSGFEKFDGFKVIDNLDVETPFGPTSSGLCQVEVNSQPCLFLSRHGSDHEKLPSEVNYRANIYALKKYGAKAILSFSAVGSLQRNYKPGDMVVPTQYIDRTKGLRPHSFCGQGVVGHVSLAHPICTSMVNQLSQITPQKSWQSHFHKTYICIEGPYFSTQAESHLYRTQGADIIGMTHYPEFALAREAGLSYLPCCFVTDYDCWDDNLPHVNLQGVIEVMRNNNAKAFELAQDILSAKPTLHKGCECADQGLRTSLFTPPDKIFKDQKSWLNILMTLAFVFLSVFQLRCTHPQENLHSQENPYLFHNNSHKEGATKNQPTVHTQESIHHEQESTLSEQKPIHNEQESIPLRAMALLEIAQTHPNGFTFDSKTFQPISKGHAVAPFKVAQTIVDKKDLSLDIMIQMISLIDKVTSLIQQPVYAGGWLNSSDGLYYLDTSMVVNKLDWALYLAKAGDQYAIYNLSTMKIIETKPGIQDLKDKGLYNSMEYKKAKDFVKETTSGILKP